MAINSTVYHAELEMVDLDRNYFETHKLTLARHPSETEERLMVRILAFALNAHERLEFGGGISESDEPDLWLKTLGGDIDLWIELGHPDERVLTRASGRSKEVRVYTYSASPERWYEPVKHKLRGLRNLELWSITAQESEKLSQLVERRMMLQCTIQDKTLWFRDNSGREAELSPRVIVLP